MQLSPPSQWRCAASLAASIAILLVLHVLLFAPSTALAAAEVAAPPESTIRVVQDDGEDEDEDDSDHDNDWDGFYEPGFSLFDRGIIGRAPVGVTALQNNEPQILNLQPGTSACYVFEKSAISADAQGHTRRDEDDSGMRDGGTGTGTGTGGDAPLPSGVVSSRMVYLSANTCLQPTRGTSNSTSMTPPPQLSIFISNHTQTGCSQTPQNVSTFQTRPFDRGGVAWSTNATGDLFITITAPKVAQGFQGVYNFEVAASVDGFYHNYDSMGGELLWMDSDSSSALLMTRNLTENILNVHKITDKGPQYELYVVEKTTTTSAVDGLLHSVCGLRNTVTLASRRLENGQYNNGDMARTKLTVHGPGAWPKQQFYLDGLNSSTSYTGILFKPGNETELSKRQVSAGGVAGGGGVVFAGTDFQTSAGTNCRVITDLDFCTEVQWAAPGNNQLNNSELAQVYDNYAKSVYANFEKVMMQIPCEAPSTQQYSLVRTCDDCKGAYKRWLCTTSIPRCEDFSKQNNFSIIRNVGQPFPNGSTLPDALVKALEKVPAWNASRNSFIDDQIAPGPYKELLPCADVCYEVVQSCPAAIGFTCPQPHLISFNGSYGQRHADDTTVTCNYPGEPRTRLSADGAALQTSRFLSIGITCFAMAMLL